jgi:hypothetical protein
MLGAVCLSLKSPVWVLFSSSSFGQLVSGLLVREDLLTLEDL